jgi:hypothetical protein
VVPGGPDAARRWRSEGWREPTFIGPDEDAPLFREPEFTLGQLYNKKIFLIGYVGEVSACAEAVLCGRPPAPGPRTFSRSCAGPRRCTGPPAR